MNKKTPFITQKPIALFQINRIYLFWLCCGRSQNTSGLGTLKNPALLAIFTYHLMEGKKAGRTDYQTQGIAYSLDNGDSWSVY